VLVASHQGILIYTVA